MLFNSMSESFLLAKLQLETEKEENPPVVSNVSHWEQISRNCDFTKPLVKFQPTRFLCLEAQITIKFVTSKQQGRIYLSE